MGQAPQPTLSFPPAAAPAPSARQRAKAHLAYLLNEILTARGIKGLTRPERDGLDNVVDAVIAAAGEERR